MQDRVDPAVVRQAVPDDFEHIRAQISFQIIPLAVAPPHLQTRYTQGDAEGLWMLIMLRPPDSQTRLPSSDTQ